MKIRLDAFIDLLPKLQEKVVQQVTLELQRMAPEIVDEIQNNIGVLQAGWAELAESTQRSRVSAGFSAADPLFAQGELLKSYGAEVSGTTLTVGSTSPIAEYQELGTATIPPRPVIMPAIIEYMETEQTRMGQVVVDALSDKKGIDQ